VTTSSRWPSLLSLMVFVVGLAASVAAGVSTYRTVGAYGGPVLTGYHHEWDPTTQQYLRIHETTTESGMRVRRLLTNGVSLKRTELTGEAVGAEVEKLVIGGARIAFSTRNDGVMDGFVTRDPKTETARVEVSTKRNGKIDRWELYIKGQMARVDVDTDGNGKPDRWMIYEDGILMDTFIDANEDGQSDDTR
jgi:hypothetical protein